MDIPVEFGWITSAYLPQPPVRGKTLLSTILRSVTEKDEPGVDGEQQTGGHLYYEVGLCFDRVICEMASVRLAVDLMFTSLFLYCAK